MTEETTLHQPALREMLALEIPIEVKLSPGGGKAAMLVRTTNWKDDCYENVCYVQDLARSAAKAAPRRLNRYGSVRQMEWLDDDTLALLKTGSVEDKQAQVWLYEGLIGEGWQVTDHKEGVGSFKPFAGGLLYLAEDPKRAEKKKRADRFGKYKHFEQEDSAAALYYLGLEPLRQYEAQQRAATEDEAKELVKPVVELSRLFAEPLHIGEMIPAPDGKSVYLNCRRRADYVYWRETSAFCLQLDAPAALAEHVRRAQEKKRKPDKEPLEEGEAAPEPKDEAEEKPEDLAYLGTLKRLNLPEQCSVMDVSPDSARLLLSFQGRDHHFYTQADLWVLDAAAALAAPDAEAARAQMRCLTAALDRLVMQAYWVPGGIFGSYIDGTVMRVARFGDDGQFTPLEFDGLFPESDFHICAAGRIGLVATNATTFPEACAAGPGKGARWHIQRLTDYGQAGGGLEPGHGRDDPLDEPGRHRDRRACCASRQTSTRPRSTRWSLSSTAGRPGISPEYLLSGEDRRYYPSVQFVNQGVLVLKPNYRGSIGRGQAFMELNVNNLGVGDLWDLESAIDHLVGAGLGRPGARRLHGLVAGRLHLGLCRAALRRLQGGLGGGGHLGLVHLPHQQRYPRLHHSTTCPARPSAIASLYAKTAPISGLRASQHADADPARLGGSPRAALQCHGAVPRPEGDGRAGGAVHLPRHGPPHHQAAREPRRDAPEPDLVQPLSVGYGIETGRVR